MKLFLDTADIEKIKQWIPSGIIDGITTNPSNMGVQKKDPKKLVQEICTLFPQLDVSVEVTKEKPQDVYEQAKRIAQLAQNITVKIPCHTNYYPVIKKLVEEGIAINVTLVFTLIQALMMCKLGVTYISPFVGRWEDIDTDGIELLHEIRTMIDTYGYSTQLLAASLRNVRHIHSAILCGVDVATVPTDLLERSLDHILSEQGITKFNADWKKSGLTDF